MQAVRVSSPILVFLILIVGTGLVPIGVICGILGVGNLLNGGHYIATGPAFVVTAIGAGAIATAVFLLWSAIRRLKRKG
jgi:hypothetical protein